MRRCPQKKIGYGLCENAWFLWQPIANLRMGGLPTKLLISQLLLIRLRHKPIILLLRMQII